MPPGIEARLEGLLAQLAGPEPAAGEAALAQALAGLPPAGSRRRLRAGRLALALAATLVLLSVAAGALAAAGALHVRFGRLPAAQPRRPAVSTVPRLVVPRGAHGIAAVVDGRLWLTTSGGLRLQGLPVSAAALSPHALYVAAGIGDALVAMAPDGRRAWSRSTAGSVAAIAWAPDGLRIAYVVREGGGFVLHLIEGNGRNDRILDRAVRPVAPSWRADSLAVAYVGAGGKPVVYDLGHRSRRVLASSSARNATQLAFAPAGAALAIGTRHGFVLAGGGAAANGFDFAPATLAGLGWLNGELAVAIDPAVAGADQPRVQLFRNESGEATPGGSLVATGTIAGFDAHGALLTVAVSLPGGVRVLAATPGTPATSVALARVQVVLELARGSRVAGLAAR